MVRAAQASPDHGFCGGSAPGLVTLAFLELRAKRRSLPAPRARLQLSEAHLGEALDSSARRTGSRRASLFGACVVRAQADQETKVITARHGILQPSLASADAVRGALADLRYPLADPSLERLRLRLRRVLAPAPLVYLECEQLAEEGEHRSATRYVMLRREKFDAVCQKARTATRPSWSSRRGTR
jgi:hypothetical protein